MLKKITYVILGLIALYFIVRLATCKEKFQENKELINKIDSLQKISTQLKEEQQKITERDSIFNKSISDIDDKINDVQGEKVIIREYYNNQTQTVKKYKPSQVDSFFKSRYNY